MVDIAGLGGIAVAHVGFALPRSGRFRVMFDSSIRRGRRRDGKGQVPEGASNDHVGWMQRRAPIVDRILSWWHTEGARHASTDWRPW
ncbi:hypothetical protein [Nocardia nova]|uniref:hypothetical protein n=1 Tax=Nocardia nova TaxID=37330 RepID=UPI0011B01515|nr:hypothetical protein [Nocardia nova]